MIIKKSKMSDACESALRHLFIDRELSSPYASKQISIRRSQDFIRSFIKRYPYAYFELRVLDEINDMNNPELTLSIRNFKKLHDLKPYNYLIVIDSSFENISFYQKTIDDESLVDMEFEMIIT